MYPLTLFNIREFGLQSLTRGKIGIAIGRRNSTVPLLASSNVFWYFKTRSLRSRFSRPTFFVICGIAHHVSNACRSLRAALLTTWATTGFNLSLMSQRQYTRSAAQTCTGGLGQRWSRCSRGGQRRSERVNRIKQHSRPLRTSKFLLETIRKLYQSTLGYSGVARKRRHRFNVESSCVHNVTLHGQDIRLHYWILFKPKGLLITAYLLYS